MTHHSYLLYTENCENTLIIWENFIEELVLLEKEDNNYLYVYKHTSTIKTLKDLAHELNDTKLCGYLTLPVKKILGLICKNIDYTILENELDKLPKMYFEEDGWDRIHYFEFYPGTDRIIWGSHALERCISDCNKKEYINGLILNNSYTWATIPFRYEERNLHDLGLLFAMTGIRAEDYNKDPEGVMRKIIDILHSKS